MSKSIIGAAALLALAGSVSAQVVDGTADAGQTQVAVQTNFTQFGNANIGLSNFANGSEIDGLRASVSGGNLHLTFTGNLESNFNKFELFIDSKAGGQNQLRNDNANVDFNGLNRMAGMTFMSGFSPDYWISTTGGDVGGGNYGYFANGAELLAGGGGNGQFLGGNNGSGALTGGNNFLNLLAAIDNSNTAGVDGGSGAGGAAVSTGMEFLIPISSLGATDYVCVFAFINGGGHDFVANQSIGGLPSGTNNLGEPSTINWGSAGVQCIQIAIPAPSTMALLGLGGLIVGRRRR